MFREKLYRLVKKIVLFLVNVYNAFYFSYIQWRYRSVVRKVRGKDKIKVAFFLIHEPVWKYDRLYRLLEQDSRFEPLVIVCPFIVYGMENMIRDMDQAFDAFLTRGYNVIKTFDRVIGEWLDIKKKIKPDIVFFRLLFIISRIITGFFTMFSGKHIIRLLFISD